MKTRTLLGKYSSTYSHTAKSTGATYNSTGTPVQTSVMLSDDKVSVNTGRFTPGVYRVNPYTIWGESAWNPSVYWSDEASDTGYTYRVALFGDVGDALANILRPYAAGINPDYSNYVQRALLKAYGKLGSSKANIGETLGEIHETLMFLRHPFQQLRDFLCSNNLRNLGLLNRLLHYQKSGLWVEPGSRTLTGVKAASVAANTWLEFRYGFMPLVLTVKDLIELVQEKSRPFDATAILAKRSKITVEVPVNMNGALKYTVMGNTQVDLAYRGLDKYTFRGTVNYRVSNLPTWQNNLGISPKFAPELAWELTRLSFVVDWWFDVSSYLARWRVQPEIQVLGNTVGIKVDRELVVLCRTCISGFAYKNIFTERGESAAFYRKYYERRVNQHLPSLPLFKLEYNKFIHVVDALALILQPILGMIRRK